MAYWEWGAPDNDDVVVCAHGLTRQGRDFDVLASRLSERYRVVCPDFVGRGRSEWLPDPKGYQIPQYAADAVTLLARVNARRLAWVGTSMGGLVGMGLAGLPGSPIERLVLNDVGPSLDGEGLRRVGEYLGEHMVFANEEEAAAALWLISTGFGPHTPEQWMALTRPLLKPRDDGQVELRYDPGIAWTLNHLTPDIVAAGEAQLWQSYDRISCPTLLLRGEQSDLLTRETAAAMGLRGPRALCREFAGIGHAPTLIAPDQVEAVVAFLASR